MRKPPPGLNSVKQPRALRMSYRKKGNRAARGALITAIRHCWLAVHTSYATDRGKRQRPDGDSRRIADGRMRLVPSKLAGYPQWNSANTRRHDAIEANISAAQILQRQAAAVALLQRWHAA